MKNTNKHVFRRDDRNDYSDSPVENYLNEEIEKIRIDSIKLGKINYRVKKKQKPRQMASKIPIVKRFVNEPTDLSSDVYGVIKKQWKISKYIEFCEKFEICMYNVNTESLKDLRTRLKETEKILLKGFGENYEIKHKNRKLGNYFLSEREFNPVDI